MRICALIPAFNEVSYVGNVVEGALHHVDEALVIDDGSTDGTAAAARAAGAICFGWPENRGKATALRAGIESAGVRGFSHVVTLDADGQHRPDDIPTLVRTAQETGADLVIGARPFDPNLMPRSRYFSNTIGSKIASALAGREIRDSQCGFRLYRLDRLRRLRLRSRSYEFEMEVLIKMARAGWVIEHAPVAMVYDNGRARSKMNPVRDTVRICLWSLAFRFLRA
jgi:glycosyltransferase involved in cell wall biosynthesis